MRAKLREIKQQLRERMHDPVRQTGHWLKSIEQGHFNYYAVPGNLDSLGAFRDRLLVHSPMKVIMRPQTPRNIGGFLLVVGTIPFIRHDHPVFPDFEADGQERKYSQQP